MKQEKEEGENIIQDTCTRTLRFDFPYISIIDLVLVYGSGIFELLKGKFLLLEMFIPLLVPILVNAVYLGRTKNRKYLSF